MRMNKLSVRLQFICVVMMLGGSSLVVARDHSLITAIGVDAQSRQACGAFSERVAIWGDAIALSKPVTMFNELPWQVRYATCTFVAGSAAYFVYNKLKKSAVPLTIDSSGFDVLPLSSLRATSPTPGVFSVAASSSSIVVSSSQNDQQSIPDKDAENVRTIREQMIDSSGFDVLPVPSLKETSSMPEVFSVAASSSSAASSSQNDWQSIPDKDAENARTVRERLHAAVKTVGYYSGKAVTYGIEFLPGDKRLYSLYMEQGDRPVLASSCRIDELIESMRSQMINNSDPEQAVMLRCDKSVGKTLENSVRLNFRELLLDNVPKNAMAGGAWRAHCWLREIESQTIEYQGITVTYARGAFFDGDTAYIIHMNGNNCSVGINRSDINHVVRSFKYYLQQAFGINAEQSEDAELFIYHLFGEVKAPQEHVLIV